MAKVQIALGIFQTFLNTFDLNSFIPVQDPAMSIRDQILTYLYLKKRDPNAPINTNIRLMHGMNRISIFIFLIAVIVMIVRLLRR